MSYHIRSHDRSHDRHRKIVNRLCSSCISRESNKNSIEFSLSIAKQRVVGFIPAWSLAFLQRDITTLISWQWKVQQDKLDCLEWNIFIAAHMRGASGYLNGTIKQLSTTNIPVTTTTISTEKPSLIPITTTTSKTNTKWQSLNPSEDK